MILEDFMITNRVYDLVSCECDCLIYTDLNAMAPQLRMEYPHALAAGPVTSNHMTGCVLYVAKREALSNFNRFMLECLKEDQVYLSADIILNAHINEMVLLAAFNRVREVYMVTEPQRRLHFWRRYPRGIYPPHHLTISTSKHAPVCYLLTFCKPFLRHAPIAACHTLLLRKRGQIKMGKRNEKVA